MTVRHCGLARTHTTTGRATKSNCALVATCLCLLWPSWARAQNRPDEQQLFGAEPPEAPAAGTSSASTSGSASTNDATATAAEVAPSASAPSTPTAFTPASTPSLSSPSQTTEASRDAQILGSAGAPSMFTDEAAPSDPLTIGGQIYLRLQGTAAQGQRFEDFSFSAPSMLDVFLDARPNDRVRGFARGRMVYDPTLPATASSSNTIGTVAASGSTSGAQSLSSLFQQQTRDPKAYLDQLWLNFDLYRRVYVTVGKQHVRWGTARFWAPTDFLHLRPRNPLDVFDARTGTSMIKFHLPIESRQWNIYAYGVTEGPNATSTLGDVAGAARAEFVLNTTEVGLGVFARRNSKPRFAVDLSTGIYDFDVYGELALRSRNEIDRVHYAPDATIPEFPAAPPSWQTPADTARGYSEQVVDAMYPLTRRHGYRPQIVGGVNYSRKYNDNDTFTVGFEYFYNSLGYDSPLAYPGLVLPHTRDLSEPANFFYLGQHYGAFYVTFPAPYKLDNHTFTLSTLGNFSDQSYITRFDYAFILLTHVRLEAFVSAHYGNENGEFRFGVKNLNIGGYNYSRAPSLMDFGMAVRVAI
jgi:hypothetical protein